MPRRIQCSSVAATPRKPKIPKISMSKVIKPESDQFLTKDRIDEWMRESVTEIVKKLPESPLLVQVYSDESGISAATVMEKAEEDQWVLVKEKWEKGEMPMPDGVIFVEKIDDDQGGEELSKAWGIVVQQQGRGNQSCYLLKTNRVGSGIGGLCCTHFCLVKVKSFRETAASQLKNCWLLQAQQ